jgi:hypothetical protein
MSYFKDINIHTITSLVLVLYGVYQIITGDTNLAILFLALGGLSAITSETIKRKNITDQE